ncbi:MAG: hypothetical protein ACJ754_12800 [Pyrinomonadaceae bacterium]
MSDYLWDKKGEPDADLARLESLLGAYAHEPRPLEWPAEATAPEPTQGTLLPFASRLRASRLYAPAALAAAAALLVASVYAASAFLRARSAGEGRRAVAQQTPRPQEETRKAERPAPPQPQQVMLAPPPGADEVKDATPAAVVKVKDEKVAFETLPRAPRRRSDVSPAAVPNRRQGDSRAETETGTTGPGLILEALSTRAGQSSLVESARLLTKEQLVYALRLTGSKLRDMRQRAQKAEARP